MNNRSYVEIEQIQNYKVLRGNLPDILLWLSENVKLKYIAGKVSSEQTLKAIDNPNIKALIRILEKATRSDLYTGPAKNNTRYCALVPLFMSAFKEYKGVNYEDWSKVDPYIEVSMGHKLWKDISPYLNGNDIDIKEAREKALYHKDKYIAKDAWPRHQIIMDNGLRLKAPNYFRHILLQTWMANVQHRNKYMILDAENWDRMPPALDETFQEKGGEPMNFDDLLESLNW